MGSHGKKRRLLRPHDLAIRPELPCLLSWINHKNKHGDSGCQTKTIFCAVMVRVHWGPQFARNAKSHQVGFILLHPQMMAEAEAATAEALWTCVRGWINWDFSEDFHFIYLVCFSLFYWKKPEWVQFSHHPSEKKYDYCRALWPPPLTRIRKDMTFWAVCNEAN